MKKLNFAIGRFQPFTLGHMNMIEEVEGDCLVFQMIPPNLPEQLEGLKLAGRRVKNNDINTVLDYFHNNDITLDKCQSEIIKRPFTNELIRKEFDIIKKNFNKIIDVIYVKTLFDGIGLFNKYLLDNSDKYECGYWLCGDDRKDEYESLIGRYIVSGDDIFIGTKSEEKYKNVISNISINTGKGRTNGISGTDVRKAIINNDKSAFEKIMPKATYIMFDEFVESFEKFKNKLKSLIKEHKITPINEYVSLNEKILSLDNYILEKLNNKKNKLYK